MRASHNFSVCFRGWKNIPPPNDAERALHARYGLSQEIFRSGECALLEVTNHVVFTQDRPVAYALYRANPDEIYLRQLFIRRD